VNKVTTHIVKGFIIGILVMVVNYFSIKAYNFQTHSTPVWIVVVSNAILFFGIIISCIIFSIQMRGNVVFKEVLGHGFKTAAVAIILLVIFNVFLYALNDKAKQTAMDYAISNLADKTNIDNYNRGIQEIKSHFYLMVINSIVFSALVISLIGTLLGAAIAKKNPQANNPFGQ
jgi:hypothetical protein